MISALWVIPSALENARYLIGVIGITIMSLKLYTVIVPNHSPVMMKVSLYLQGIGVSRVQHEMVITGWGENGLVTAKP